MTKRIGILTSGGDCAVHRRSHVRVPSKNRVDAFFVDHPERFANLHDAVHGRRTGRFRLRPRDGSANVGKGEHFILVQNNDAGNEIMQIRFCVCCGERFVADEYRFDDLLSQMPAAVQDGAKAFATRPFRTVSEHAWGVCVAKRCGASRSAIFRQAIKRVRYLRRRAFEAALEFEVAKRQFKRIVDRITAHPVVSNLGPAACRQTNIGPV